ncbi:hypothetical protein SEMRO_462_G148040.1 [Seminavis robusta]|uniref:Uncharacterized protein n=1 Tax=Seminavis robusta TaxID=568900 RepID=A0A9N8DXZ7_9STRA|nr:hypothetical protein SEMRO_462_G148040.1 [Seminavis robusta]|eukprot:Sro462_g148040.1 n/a (226) ;mRNA; r:52891-53871
MANSDDEDSAVSSDDSFDGELEIYTPSEMLAKGLGFLGYTEKQLNRKNLSEETKQDRLVSHFGANSFVLAHLWEDLQKAPNKEDRLDSGKRILRDYFQALYFLKLYEPENPRASRFQIFSECGLADKLRRIKKKCISDGGYRGFPDLVSTPNNAYDLPEVQKFKSRARLRHERYNGMLKTFHCLSESFRHGKSHADSKAKLCSCLEAVAVIVQYRMEYGEPLYDI